jgi:translation initiation factor 1
MSAIFCNTESTASSASVSAVSSEGASIIEGINDVATDINKLAKILKSSCAAGGTVKDRTIELQGEHKKRAAKVLEQNGYQVEVR